MTQEEFVQFAEAQQFTAEDCPILLGGGRGWWPFPCIDTNRGRLVRLNRNRGARVLILGRNRYQALPLCFLGYYYIRKTELLNENKD